LSSPDPRLLPARPLTSLPSPKSASIPDGQGITVALGDRLSRHLQLRRRVFCDRRSLPSHGRPRSAPARFYDGNRHPLPVGTPGASKSPTAPGAIIRGSRSTVLKPAWSAMRFRCDRARRTLPVHGLARFQTTSGRLRPRLALELFRPARRPACV